MRLRFLGTGIGSGSAPQDKLKKRLSPEYRRADAVLLDDRILLGSSMGTCDFEETFSFGGLSRDIRTVILPHSESLDIPSLEELARHAGVTLCGTAALAPLVEGIPNVTYLPLTPYHITEVAGIRILPLPSTYRTEDPREIPLHFLILGDRHLFFAPDGGWLYPETYSVLADTKCHAAILDCGLGDAPFSAESFRHNNLTMATHLREAMIAGGCAAPDALFLLTCIPTIRKREIHAELSLATEDLGMKVAYDGYFVNL